MKVKELKLAYRRTFGTDDGSQVLGDLKKRFSFEKKYGIPPPRAFVISTTDDCQSNCEGCGTKPIKGKKKINTFSSETLEDLYNQTDDMGTLGTGIVGGDVTSASSKGIFTDIYKLALEV